MGIWARTVICIKRAQKKPLCNAFILNALQRGV